MSTFYTNVPDGPLRVEVQVRRLMSKSASLGAGSILRAICQVQADEAANAITIVLTNRPMFEATSPHRSSTLSWFSYRLFLSVVIYSIHGATQYSFYLVSDYCRRPRIRCHITARLLHTFDLPDEKNGYVPQNRNQATRNFAVFVER
jgi:hypothetical protein